MLLKACALGTDLGLTLPSSLLPPPYLAPRVVPSALDLVPENTMGQEGGDADCEVPAGSRLQVRLRDHSQIVDTFSKMQVLWAQDPRGQLICRKQWVRGVGVGVQVSLKPCGSCI